MNSITQKLPKPQENSETSFRASLTDKCRFNVSGDLEAVRNAKKTAAMGLSSPGTWKSSTITVRELAEHIQQGKHWMPVTLKDDSLPRKSSNANSCEVLAVDIDGGLTIKDALEHPFIAKHAALITTSCTHRLGDNGDKMRVVFVLAKPIKGEANIKKANQSLQNLVEQSDKSCKDAARLFFGAHNCEILKLTPEAVIPEQMIDAWETEWVSESQTPLLTQYHGEKQSKQPRKLETVKGFQHHQQKPAKREYNPDKDDYNTELLITPEVIKIVSSMLSHIPYRVAGTGTYNMYQSIINGVRNSLGEIGIQLLENWDKGIGDWGGMAIREKAESFESTQTSQKAFLGSLVHYSLEHGFKWTKQTRKEMAAAMNNKNSRNENTEKLLKLYDERCAFTADDFTESFNKPFLDKFDVLNQKIIEGKEFVSSFSTSNENGIVYQNLNVDNSELPFNEFFKGNVIISKSGMGTGKTTAIIDVVNELFKVCKPRQTPLVLVLSHSLTLGDDIIRKFNDKLPAHLKGGFTRIDSENPQLKNVGGVVTLDSLDKIEYDKTKPVLFIIDEYMQLMDYAMTSTTTVGDKRFLALNFLTEMVCNVINGGGVVYTADANFTNDGRNHLHGMLKTVRGMVKPFNIINTHKKLTGRKVVMFDDKNDLFLYSKGYLDTETSKGVVFGCTKDTQSTSSTKCVMEYLGWDDSNTLEINSNTTKDKNHTAFHAVANMDAAIRSFKNIVASPSVCTGVDIQETFDFLCALNPGMLDPHQFMQVIGRARNPQIPVFIYSIPHGHLNAKKVWGHGVNYQTPEAIIENEQKRLETISNAEKSCESSKIFNALLLTCIKSKIKLDSDTINWNDCHLKYWAYRAVWKRLCSDYLSLFVEHELKKAGYDVTSLAKGAVEGLAQTKAVKKEIKSISKNLTRKRNEMIAASEVADENEALELEEKRRKTLTEVEQRKLQYLNIRKVVGADYKITPDSVQMYHDKLHSKARNFFYISETGRQYCIHQVAKQREKMRERNGGVDDVLNINSMLAFSKLLNDLGINEIIASDELHNEHEKVKAFFNYLKSNLSTVQHISGLNQIPDKTPMAALNAVLDLVGLKCYYYARQRVKTSDGTVKQVRVFGKPIVAPQERTEKITETHTKLTGEQKQITTTKQVLVRCVDTNKVLEDLKAREFYNAVLENEKAKAEMRWNKLETEDAMNKDAYEVYIKEKEMDLHYRQESEVMATLAEDSQQVQESLEKEDSFNGTYQQSENSEKASEKQTEHPKTFDDFEDSTFWVEPDNDDWFSHADPTFQDFLDAQNEQDSQNESDEQKLFEKISKSPMFEASNLYTFVERGSSKSNRWEFLRTTESSILVKGQWGCTNRASEITFAELLSKYSCIGVYDKSCGNWVYTDTADWGDVLAYNTDCKYA